MWDKVLGLLKSNFIKDAGAVVDNLTGSDEEKSTAKNKLTKLVTGILLQVKQLQTSVVLAEIGKGSWLTTNWRPLVMITLTLLLVAKWAGFTVEVDSELELELMKIIKLGLVGYVGGRSLEKIADTVTKNIDIPFLKKKNRDIK